MSKQLIIHILEFTLSFIYVMLIWPVYEGEDYLWGCFICISYIIIIASYCIMRQIFHGVHLRFLFLWFFRAHLAILPAYQ